MYDRGLSSFFISSALLWRLCFPHWIFWLPCQILVDYLFLVIFPWIFMFMEVSVTDFINSSHFLYKEISFRILLEILRLSQAFYGYACSILLAHFCGRILTLVLRLLLTLQCTRSSVGSLSLLCPKVTLPAQAPISPWTANWGLLLHVFICCCLLKFYPYCHLWESTQEACCRGGGG